MMKSVKFLSDFPGGSLVEEKKRKEKTKLKDLWCLQILVTSGRILVLYRRHHNGFGKFHSTGVDASGAFKP